MIIKRLSADQTGFTLVELLVVIGILAILLVITIIAINPTQQFQSARNAQRQSDVSAILDAIYQYEAGNAGQLPTVLGASMTAGTAYDIATAGTNHVDLCAIASSAVLVPNYLADLPSDPSQASPRTPAGSNCSTATAYTTGYKITKSASGNRFTVSAPLAENGVTVSVSR